MMKNIPKSITNPYRLAIVALRSVDTGERGYYIGEPMLAMMNDPTPTVAMSIDPTELVVSGDTPVSELMDSLRRIIGMT